MKKMAGYIVMILGAVILVGSSAIVKLALFQNISKNLFLVIGALLMLLGFFFTLTKKEKQELEDLPIYEGQKVVGYRRKK